MYMSVLLIAVVIITFAQGLYDLLTKDDLMALPDNPNYSNKKIWMRKNK